MGVLRTEVPRFEQGEGSEQKLLALINYLYQLQDRLDYVLSRMEKNAVTEKDVSEEYYSKKELQTILANYYSKEETDDLLSGAGGELDPELLWTNSNAGTAFAAQTVSLDLTEYPLIVIYYGESTSASGQAMDIPQIYRVGTKYPTRRIAISSGMMYFLEREATVQTSGVTFSDCELYEEGNLSAITDNTGMIPHTIYGIK